MKNLYQLLEVDSQASLEVLNQAYRSLATKYHPDRAQSTAMKKSLAERFKDISDAYTILSDRKQREAYDEDYQAYLKAKQSTSTLMEKRKRRKQLQYWTLLTVFLWLTAEMLIKTFSILPLAFKLAGGAVVLFLIWSIFRPNSARQ